MAMKSAVVLISGGLDSATALALAREAGFRVFALSFDYGQRHRFELDAAKRVCDSLGVERHIVLTRVPAIGRREPNVYYMQGYCGHGVNTTHIAGDIVADAIAGTMERFDLFEKIRHVRLPVGQFLGNPRPRIRVAIEDANGAALFEKTRRGSPTYAARAARHQYVLALQAAHGSPPVTRTPNDSTTSDAP